MRMLLLSYNVGAVPGFLGTPNEPSRAGMRVAYVDDAAAPLRGTPFVAEERERMARLGYTLVDLTAGEMDAEEFGRELDESEAVYVAGGRPDALLAALERTGADDVLVQRVRAGLPYIGASAGAVIMGQSIEPGVILAGRTAGVELPDLSGLGVLETSFVPHADGKLPPFPPEKVAKARAAVAGQDVTALDDDQALLIDGDRREIVASPEV